MDEIKETEVTTTDEGFDETTPTEPLTEAQEKLVRKLISDAKAEWGRDKKVLETKLTEVEKELGTHKSTREAVAAKSREIMAKELAVEFTVDPETLLKFGGSKPEIMKELAQLIGKKKESTDEEIVPDTLEGTGAGGKTSFTAKEIDSMDTSSFTKHREAVLKALAGGKIKD